MFGVLDLDVTKEVSAMLNNQPPENEESKAQIEVTNEVPTKEEIKLSPYQ